MRAVFRAAGVATAAYDAQFFDDWRDGFWIATNFSSKNESAPIPSSAKIPVEFLPRPITLKRCVYERSR